MPRRQRSAQGIETDGELRLPVRVTAGVLALIAAACTTPSRRVAVTSGVDGSVVVFDGDLRTADTVPRRDDGMGRRTGAWLAFDGSTLFTSTATAAAGALERARLADGAVLERVDFYAAAPAVVHPLFDGATVLVATGEPRGRAAHGALHVLALDLSSRTAPIPICDGPVLGLGTVRATDRVYLLCERDRVAEVDRRLGTLVRTVDLPAPGAEQARCGASDIGMASTGSIVFVLCAGTGRLLYLDRVTLDVIDSLVVGSGGSRLARAPNGQHVVVMRPDPREVVVADVRRRIIVGTITTEYVPLAVVAGADSRTAFVTTGRPDVPGRLLSIDLRSASVRTEASTVSMPITVSAWPGEESPVMRWNR